MSGKTGRKSDPIWYHFEKMASNTSTGCRAKCKICGHEMQGLVKRMQSHYDKCLATQADSEDGASIIILDPQHNTGGKFFLNII